MNGELIRIVDSLHRDKSIDKEIVFTGIESALATACRKHFGIEEDVTVIVNRETGAITATERGHPVDPETLGRIAAQTAKQVMIQKIREAERDVIFAEFEERIGTLVNGTVQRFEGRNIIVNLSRTEGILPVSEQMRNESYRVGERIQCVIYEVKKAGPRVRIVLSRGHVNLIRRLFELEVPEIAERIIDIRAIAREAGHRTKVAVSSIDPRVDCVGACVGVRGTRIKSIVDEVNGEKIDIVRWNDSVEVLIMNALKPAEIEKMILDDEVEPKKATVFVRDDQLSLAIGKKGQNVRLASKLAQWDIDIVPSEDAASRISAEEVLGLLDDRERAARAESPTLGLSEDIFEILKKGGFSTRDSILAAGVDVLAKVQGFDEDQARLVIRTLASQAFEESEQEDDDKSTMDVSSAATETATSRVGDPFAALENAADEQEADAEKAEEEGGPTDDDAVGDEASGDASSDDQASDDEASDDETSDDETSDDETPNDQTPDDGTVDEETPDQETPAEKALDGETSTEEDDSQEDGVESIDDDARA